MSTALPDHVGGGADADWRGSSFLHIAHERVVVGEPGAAVHVRVLGSGPPLVMVHMSPLCGEFLLPLAAALAPRFTCYLPDTPGYGQSDPMAGPISIEAYARRLLDVIDRLGMRRCGVYGSHTGAKIALAAADLAPERVSALILDGLRLTAQSQRDQRLAGYATRFPIRDSGAHLVDHWHRVWTTSAAWSACPSQARRPAMVAALIRPELQARPWFGVAYHAAFACDPRPLLERSTVESLLLSRTSDRLSYQLADQALPAQCTFEVADDASGERDVATVIGRYMQPRLGDEALGVGARRPAAHRLTVPVPGVSLGVELLKPTVSRSPVVLVRGLPAPGPAGAPAPEPAGEPATVIVDLPGTGRSEWTATTAFTAATLRAQLTELADILGWIDPVWLAGGLVGPALPTAGPLRPATTGVSADVTQYARLAEVLEHTPPVASGSHLIDIWDALPAPARAARGPAVPTRHDLFAHLLALTAPVADYLATVVGRSTKDDPAGMDEGA